MIRSWKIQDTEYYYDSSTGVILEGEFRNNEAKKSIAYELPNDELDGVTIFLTTRCNACCIYCYENSDYWRGLDGALGPGATSLILDDLKSIKKINKVSFFGGEPLLNFEMLKLIVRELNRTKQIGRFSVTTNAVLLTEDMANFLVDNQFEVVISLDGPATVHNKVRKGCDHDVVLKNVKKLLSYGLNNLKVNCTFTSYHEQVISKKDLEDYFLNNGIELYTISDEFAYSGGKDILLELRESIDLSIRDLSIGKVRKNFSSYLKSVVEMLAGVHTSHFCVEMDPNFTRTYNIKGERVPCPALIGGALDNEVSNIKVQNKVCATCWAEKLCRCCCAKLVLDEEQLPNRVEDCMRSQLYDYAIRKFLEAYGKDKEIIHYAKRVLSEQ